MNKYVDVSISWLNNNVKLEQIFNNEVRFCTQIRFDDEGDKIPQWTAEIIINCIDKNQCFGKMRYLFDKAPQYLMKKGNLFIIFDGPNKVAKGEVL